MNRMSTIIKCDLCGSEEHEKLYKPINTKRDVDVVICKNCGLLYSVHDPNIPYSREPNPSCDADWGNVRFCKGQRFDVLKPDMPLSAKRILDVGSSRGHFVTWAREAIPSAHVVALEPDTRIAYCPNDIQFIGQRIEDAYISPNYFDFVYCCQTLEHTDSATKVLEKIHSVMAPGGILFVEVPNTPEVLSYAQNTEEFFIDKHNFHFTHETMYAYLRKTGFILAYKREDRLNVSVFAVKAGDKIAPEQADYTEMAALVRRYAENIATNRQKVSTVVNKVNDLLDTGMKVAFWGANTLMDLMVKHGGLDPKRVQFLADDYMADCLTHLHGIEIHKSEEFRIYQPDVVVVLARFNADLLAQKARRFGVRNIVKFADLME